MSERNRDPVPHPIAVRLTRENVNEVEDVIQLVGFVAPRTADGTLRIFADEQFQRFLDVPDAALVDADPLPDDPRGRTRVWVSREAMIEPAFGEEALDGLDAAITGPRMSTWQFLPDNRIAAAEMLGLLPEETAS